MSIYVNVVLVYRHGFFAEDVKKVGKWVKSLNPLYSPFFTALIESHERVLNMEGANSCIVVNDKTAEVSDYMAGQHLYVINAATQMQVKAIKKARDQAPSHAGAVVRLHKEGDLSRVEETGLICVDFRSENGISRCPEYHYLERNGEILVLDNVKS